MPYVIKKLPDYIPEDKPLYFCDANVWIAVLKNSGSKGTEKRDQPYIDFFDAVINLNNVSDPKVLKKIKNQPKFVLTSMLVSEIINAYMRNVAMRLFYGGGDEYKKHDFKKEYRDLTHSDYFKELKALTSDISAFKDYVILMDDDFNKINPINLFSSLKSNFDFNDYYYYALLLGKDIPIITHDKDFSFQDIEIITTQSELLKLK